MNPTRLADEIDEWARHLWFVLRWGVRWRYLWARGLSGDSSQPEVSERARSLTEAWDRTWHGVPPIPWDLRGVHGDRWLRFHSLPESKRYAESPSEHRELLHRHTTVLTELLDGQPVESLAVVAIDWCRRDLATGWHAVRSLALGHGDAS